MPTKPKVPKKEVKRYIFVDLDNTLVDVNVAWKNRPRQGGSFFYLLNKNISSKPFKYDAVLRPGALDLLKALRKLKVPVYMFSAASRDYAVEINKLFKLGFPKSKIIARGNYPDRDGSLITKLFTAPPVERTILIDNYEDTVPACAAKMAFLRTIGAPKLYVVRHFQGYMNQEFKPEDIQRIVDFAANG